VSYTEAKQRQQRCLTPTTIWPSTAFPTRNDRSENLICTAKELTRNNLLQQSRQPPQHLLESRSTVRRVGLTEEQLELDRAQQADDDEAAVDQKG
jgi:hypothetical protein